MPDYLEEMRLEEKALKKKVRASFKALPAADQAAFEQYIADGGYGKTYRDSFLGIAYFAMEYGDVSSMAEWVQRQRAQDANEQARKEQEQAERRQQKAARRQQKADAIALAIATGTPVPAEFRREGRCSCCNRRLTDPESIRLGIGPECRKAEEYNAALGLTGKPPQGRGNPTLVDANMNKAKPTPVPVPDRSAVIAHFERDLRQVCGEYCLSELLSEVEICAVLTKLSGSLRPKGDDDKTAAADAGALPELADAIQRAITTCVDAGKLNLEAAFLVMLSLTAHLKRDTGLTIAAMPGLDRELDLLAAGLEMITTEIETKQ